MKLEDLQGMNGLAYLRKSRKDIEAELRGEKETLAKHRRDLQELAKNYKINVAIWFEEVVSGESISERPEMQKILTEVNTGNWDFVLCIDIDRFGRGDMKDQGVILETFRDTDTFIITPRKVYDLNDELDEEFSEFESFMSRREYKLIKRRLQRGRVRSIKDGKFIGSTPPFGYDISDDFILIPNKDAEVVKMIFNWYVYGDETNTVMGTAKIAKKLQALNIKTATGKIYWHPNVILQILRNEVYIGKIQWKKTLRNKLKKIYQKKDKSQWISIDGKHDGIIDLETFNLAQESLKNRSVPKINIGKVFRNPLMSILVCKVCEHKMVLKNPNKVGENYNRQWRLKCNFSGCPTCTSGVKDVEDKIVEDIKSYLSNLEVEKKEIEKGLETGKQIENPYINVISDLNKQLSGLKLQENNLDTLLEQGVYSYEKYSSRIKIITDEITKVVNALKEAEKGNEQFLKKENSIPKKINIITNVLEQYLKTEDNEIKNELLKSIIEVVYYSRNNRYEEVTTEVVFKEI